MGTVDPAGPEAAAWLQCMTGDAAWWSAVVDQCAFVQSCTDRRPGPEDSRVCAHGCSMCGMAFPTGKALAQHQRVRHALRNPVKAALGDTTVCPICRTDFVQRFRLVAHLSEQRQGRRGCRDAFLAAAPRIDASVAEALGPR